MKIKELIKKLKKYPDNMSVEIDIGGILSQPIKKLNKLFIQVNQ